MTAKNLLSGFQSSRFWTYVLLAFGIGVVLLVVSYFIRRSMAMKKAEQSVALEKYQQGQVSPAGNPVLPPTSTPPINAGTVPLPQVVNDIPSYIETLCWMTREIVKTGGTSDWRCTVCNNVKSLGENDLRLWASVYKNWYGRDLKTDLNDQKYFDCGCVPFFCGCGKPDMSRINSLFA
ncbi:MAG: hypothetical protein H7246_21795 [Phycisphaerae bacterium]|nr:hypothetical protein [Saprospiraceae bacterium]